MRQQGQRGFDYGHRTTDAVISRRVAVSSSGLMLFGLLSGSVFGQEKKEPQDELPAMEIDQMMR